MISHKTTPLAKKATALIFLLFLFLYSQYAPWSGVNSGAHSWLQQIFTLYFFIANQTLGIVHEAGHGICYILHCPEFITAANGTAFQLLFPALIGYYYKRRGQLFGALIGLFFLGFSLQYTAWYISTSQEGLYISAAKSFLGVDGYHDFNFLLTKMHLLDYHSLISGFTKFIATVIMMVATFWMLLDAFTNSARKGV